MGIYIEQLEARLAELSNEVERLESSLAINMTKREKLAGMAMQGMLGDVETLKAVRQNGDTLPAASVKMADALLKALETKEEG